jgi:hypothetical protein
MYRIIFSVAWSALTILGLAWGINYEWPDNVHIDYGLPLVWGVHTVVAFTGPVDVWHVNLANLVYDLIFWLALMVVVNTLIGWASARHAKRKG